jgi:hypothetical protein
MIGIILTAFNFLLLLLVWNFFLKKTILDAHRDELFDLRCQLRNIFATHNALGSRSYAQTRSLINAQIALTENLSILQYVLWKKFTKNEELKGKIVNNNIDLQDLKNDELIAAVKKIRSDASFVCSSYMILSSLFLTVMVFITAFFMGFCWLVKNIFYNFKSIFSVIFKESTYAKLWEGAISKTHINQDIVEDASIFLMKKA